MSFPLAGVAELPHSVTVIVITDNNENGGVSVLSDTPPSSAKMTSP